MDNLSYRFLSVTLPPLAQVACSRPLFLPERALNTREVVHYWGRDRAALLICEQRRAAAVRAVLSKGEGELK
ncbi:hypothetical protein [Bartonella harrusi]|uniref:Uncharacterized protein n=1 Tax=Bartonella harrusi TaxID=2961895 RepID=A0ABY5EV48_9HYPH|nr:hypothetical protein [Bartonella harrusi]UTO29297.1 hypothetical protein NMK50_05110 [Bartonella harrusi]